MRRLLLASALVLATTVPAVDGVAGLDPSDVLVLYNHDDPEALPLARRYAAARHLPDARLLALQVPRRPDLTLDEFRATIEEPLRDHLFREDLEDHVRVLVLVRGIPVRVRLSAGFVSTAALLAVMDRPIAGRPQRGIPGTPDDVAGAEARGNGWRDGHFPRDAHPGGRPYRLVTALDGWTPEDVTALIERSVASDGAPPTDPLFVFQDAAGNAQGRNANYPAGIEALRARGLRVEAAPAGADAVRERRDLMGWMSGGSYSRLNDEGVTSNHLAPGAIVDMLESFGAVPENFVEDGKHRQYPVPMMVRAGATGVHGAVAEPYAHTFPDVRLFDRYAAGLTLAEAFHASLPYLHWQNLVIGDPLAAPFAPRPSVSIEGVPDVVTDEDPVTVIVTTEAQGGAPDAVRLALHVDGVEIATADGPDAEFDLLPAAWPDGEHLLLVTARLDDDLDTRGFAGRRFRVDLERARVLEREPRSGAFAVPAGINPTATWSGRARSTPRIVLRDADGDRVAGRSRTERGEGLERVAPSVRFEPSRPLRAGETYEWEVVGLSSAPAIARFTVGAAALEIDLPERAVAGERIQVGVRLPKDVLPTALSGEIVEVRASNPPVLLARRRLDPDPPPEFGIPVRLPRSGAITVSVRTRGSGAAARGIVNVAAGEPARIVVRAPRLQPVGEPFDASLEVRDAHGNRVDGFDGTVVFTAPRDPDAEVPAGPVPVTGGRARAEGVVLATPGTQVLVATVEGLGEGGTALRAEATTIRNWRLAGPWPAADAPTDAALRALRAWPEADLAGRPWRTPRVTRPQFDPGKEAGVLVAITRIETPDAVDVEFHVGHGGVIEAWLEGEPLHAGAAGKPTAVRSKVAARLPGGPVTLVLRLTLRGQGQDAFAVAVRTPDGKPVPGLRIR